MTTTPAQPTRRINRGRGHSYELDGRHVPGITTVLSKAWPKPALMNAAKRLSGECVINEWETLEAMTPAARGEYVRTASDREWHGAKIRGTNIHKYAEQLAAGEEIEVPDEYRDHVDSYLAFADEWQPAELMVERPVFSRQYLYAGTPDLVAVLKDGRTWILDWKTGAKGGVFLEFVLQLAAARFADFALDDDGNEVPLPSIDAAGVVTLTAEGFRLVPVEANKAAWRMFRALRWMAEEMVDNSDAWIGDPL